METRTANFFQNHTSVGCSKLGEKIVEEDVRCYQDVKRRTRAREKY